MDWLTRFYQNRPQASGGRPAPEQPMLSPEMLARIDAELLQRAATQQPGFHEQTMNVASERGYPGPQSAQFNRVIGESLVPNLVDTINRAFRGESLAQFVPGLTGQGVAERAGYSGIPAAGLGLAIDAGTPGGPLDRVMDFGKAAGALAMAIPPSLRARLADTLTDLVGTRAFGRLADDQLELYLDAQRTLPQGKRDFLTPYSVEDLRAKTAAGGRVFMNPEGAAYIIDADGDLQGVFNAGEVRGLGQDAVRQAIRDGARTLDAYDVPEAIAGVNLPAYYGRFGFVETKRLPWSDEFAPPGWDYETYGRPDVVFMELAEEAAQ